MTPRPLLRLPSDDDSGSSSPHIFTDSDSRSHASVSSTVDMTPKRNISRRDSRVQKTTPVMKSILRQKSSSVSFHRAYNIENRIDTGNAAHLFLSYAENPMSVSAVREGRCKDKSRKAWRIRSSVEEDIRLLNTEKSLDDFELECDLFLQTNQKLSQDRASDVSRALKRAARNILPSDTSEEDNEGRNARFWSFLRSALDQQDAGNTEITDDVTVSSTGVEVVGTVEESISLRAQLKRQSEELDFLRSALKSLVHTDSQWRDPPFQEYSNKHYPSTSTKRQPLPSVDPIIEIPQNIQVPRLSGVIDNISDDGDSLSDITSSEKIVTISAVPSDIFPAKSRYNHFEVPRSDHNIYPSNMMTSVEATGLVVPNAIKKKSLSKDISFPKMAKGEIQDKRARGMRYNIYIKSWSLSLQGAYTGTIRRGQPDGSGVMRFDDCNYYIGEFREGLLHGEGTLFIRSDGRLEKFRGMFERNEFVGQRRPKLSAVPSNVDATRKAIQY